MESPLPAPPPIANEYFDAFANALRANDWSEAWRLAQQGIDLNQPVPGRTSGAPALDHLLRDPRLFKAITQDPERIAELLRISTTPLPVRPLDKTMANLIDIADFGDSPELFDALRHRLPVDPEYLRRILSSLTLSTTMRTRVKPWAWAVHGTWAAADIDQLIYRFISQGRGEVALNTGHLDCVEWYFRQRPSLEDEPWTMGPLVHLAIRELIEVRNDLTGEPDVLDRVLAWGASSLEVDGQGLNALHVLMLNGDAPGVSKKNLITIAKRLTVWGVPWEAPDRDGETPLSYAREHFPEALYVREETEAVKAAASLAASVPRSPEFGPTKGRARL